VPFYPYILIFIKPSAFILAAAAAKKPFWQICLLFFAVSTISNVAIYYFPDIVTRIKTLGGRRKPKKQNGLHRRTRIMIWKWGKKFKIIPLFLFFISPLVPIPLFKQICLVIGRITRTPFVYFLLLTVLQFFLIYFLGNKI